MVLESLIRPIIAEDHPRRLILIGALYALFSMILSLWIFPTYAVLISVFFVSILCAPLYYKTIKLEEEKDVHDTNEKHLLYEHGKAVRFLANLFLGTMLVFGGLYLVLPSTTVQEAYAVQLHTITEFNSQANSQLSGQFKNQLVSKDSLLGKNSLTGNAVSPSSVFTLILLNNLKVLFISFFVSFLTGGGILLILFWNSSIMGTALGGFIQQQISAHSSENGLTFLGYIGIGLLGFFRYSLHGLPEMIAYIIAGFAGGLLSYAVTTHLYANSSFETVLRDVLDLLLIAGGVLFLAGIIEVFFTPILL